MFASAVTLLALLCPAPLPAPAATDTVSPPVTDADLAGEWLTFKDRLHFLYVFVFHVIVKIYRYLYVFFESACKGAAINDQPTQYP